VIAVFLVVGIAFVPFGLACLRASTRVSVFLPLAGSEFQLIWELLSKNFLLAILAVQVAEIVHRYDVDCVPNAYRGNKQAYIKDSSIPKNCIQEVKVIRYLICLL
jgi:hypothetical protein